MNICKRVALTLAVLFAALCLAPAAANAMTIYANIEGEAGDPLTLEVESGDSIGNVKVKISEQTGLARDRQNLYFDEQFLDPYLELSHYNIQKESTLTVKLVVPITDTYFPDGTFREFVAQYDTAKDGVLDGAEIAAVKEMDCQQHEIASLEGIQYFTALENLNCFRNSLESLDVSKNSSLKVLDCGGNKLTALSLVSNVNLEKLFCNRNSLGTLDLSSNAKLTNLDCTFCGLTSLDISNCPELSVLYCGYNKSLASLDVTKNAKLKELYCYGDGLTSLNLSGNASLVELNCEYNALTTLDLSSCPSLGRLECMENQLSGIDVSSNPNLYFLNCGNNQLASLDVSKNSQLSTLYCFENQLTSLDVSNNAELSTLSFFTNYLTSIDVSNNPELDTLNCSENRLTSLDLSNNSKLSMVNTDASKCSLLIGVDGTRSFDLSTLPGFDANKASGWTGGKVSGTILTVDEGADTVTYTYDTGHYIEGRGEYTVTFTLEIGYAVSFDTAGGSAVESQTVAKGGTATKPTDPTKDKCTFAGWYADEACTQSFDFSAPITRATTVFAKWTPVKDEGEDEDKDKDEKGEDEQGEQEKGNEDKEPEDTTKPDGSAIPQTGDSAAACMTALLAGAAALTAGLAAKARKRN